MGDSPSRQKVGLTSGLALLLLSGHAYGACTIEGVDLRGPSGNAHFTVEIADSDSERSLGLMNRDSLATGSGMLFAYESPRPVSFWMKNTRIPLDLIFVRADGSVAWVHPMARPFDETPVSSGEPVQFVLEISGGLATRLGIGEATVMRHPLIDQGVAIWPCQSG